MTTLRIARAHLLVLTALAVLALLAIESRVRPWTYRHADMSLAIGSGR